MSELSAQFRQVRASLATEQAQSEIDEILESLEASEYLLIQLMVDNKIWKGSVPPRPPGDGELELGFVPYLVNNPPAFLTKFLNEHRLYRFIWNHVVEAALPTHIDSANANALFTALGGRGLVGGDGTIYGTSTYEQLDPQWIFSFLDYLYSRYAPDGKACFNSPKGITPIPLQGKTKDQITIAMMGDWGTGPYSDNPSVEVIQQISGLDPDYIIHLGDVYYAGTNSTYPPPHEEQDNFLNQWPTAQQQKPGTSFTMNSNHEMYSGAKGLYDVALKDSRFAAQKKATYFALQYGDLTIVGLDSAFFSQSFMVMKGSIGDPTDPQPIWLSGLKLDPSKTIILTHHNPIEYDGSSPVSDKGVQLYTQVQKALGGDPLAWYWGHVHNGIVYKAPLVNGSKTLGRCMGHGAIPLGKATGLPTQWVEFFTATPNPAAGSPRVYNGFVLLTITSKGKVTEEFYEQRTNKVVYSNSY